MTTSALGALCSDDGASRSTLAAAPPPAIARIVRGPAPGAVKVTLPWSTRSGAMRIRTRSSVTSTSCTSSVVKPSNVAVAPPSTTASRRSPSASKVCSYVIAVETTVLMSPSPLSATKETTLSPSDSSDTGTSKLAEGRAIPSNETSPRRVPFSETATRCGFGPSASAAPCSETVSVAAGASRAMWRSWSVCVVGIAASAETSGPTKLSPTGLRRNVTKNILSRRSAVAVKLRLAAGAVAAEAAVAMRAPPSPRTSQSVRVPVDGASRVRA